MASSMAPNERRWTSTRKSGMTVLGKVPKPINLPSQKLENHGLDPNVEIVPKGTLTWGARPPLVASNTWGTSALSSPQADGSVNSPNFANGRPSSGGSGTRPSTSSSERSNEPAASLWGPSSRPSSASGILPTCHISAVANRPRSAETRSSSSQLSRFAESLDNTAGGAAGNLGKFAAETSERCDFTLSSGDFPTLGSEKSYELKSQQGNGNPGQALHGTFNSWSADSDPHAGKDASTRSENWHRDYHIALPQLNANIPPQQFVSWNGHPVHPPNGVWYGGHEAGGPYRLPGPPQSCHIGMYSPYPTAGGILNTEAFPRPEAIPGRVQLKNGEACSYMHPESYFARSQSVIPVRPGIYPGPILYEGCYGPPCASSDNSSEQDTSTKGMPRQYGVHNLHSSEKLRQKLQKFHAQADGFDAVRTKEQMVAAHTNETQGRYNVLLKQHDSCKDKEAFERGNQLGFSAPEAGLLNNSYKQEQTTDRQHGEVHHSQHAEDLVDSNIGNSLETSKVAGDDVTTKPVTATEQVSHIQHNPIIINASLMEKVEGSNSKAQVAEVHFEGEILPTKEKMKSDCRSITNTQHFQKDDLANASSAINCISGSSNAVDCQVNSFTRDSTHQSAISLRITHSQSAEQTYVPDKSSYSEDGGQSQPHNQKRVHDIKAKVDLHNEKLKFGTCGDDGMNSIMQRHSLEDINMTAGKSGHELSMPGLCASEVTLSDQSSRIILKSGSHQSTLESVDHDVQHTKLKELARQRGIQLQKEEEQRTMEQKAKALAKLNELNLRTSASSKHNSSHPIPLCNDILNVHETASCKDAEANTIVIEVPWSCLSCDFAEQKQANDDNSMKKLRDPADFSYNEFSRASQSSFQVSGTPSEQSLSLGQRSTPVIVTGRAASDSHDSNVSKRKQAGYRRRRTVLYERSQSEKLTNFENSGNTKPVSMASEYLTNSLGILNNEDHVQTRNKNNSGPKYKNKLIDSQPNSPLPASPHPEGSSGKFDLENDETKSLATGVEVMPVSEKISDEPAVDLCSIGLRVPPNQAGSETSKSTFVRASNYWKPHSHRKPARNLQSDKTKYQGSETVVWAPVKLVCQNESSVVHKSSTSQITDLPDGKIGLDIHSGAKARRAEMERYVPKPIAKELSLHGGSQLSSPLSAPVSSADESKELDLASASAQTGRDCSSVAKTALASANRNIENNKQNRQGKPHASWRQRNSGESESHGQGAVEGGLFSETPKCVEKMSELQSSVPSDNCHVGGGNGMRNEPTSELGAIKNNSASRQRRHQFKTQRVDSSSYSLPLSNVLQGEEPDKSKIESQIPDDSGERYSSRNENQNAGSDHMRSHWKPKSRVYPQQSSHDYKGSGGERAADKLLPSQATTKFFDDSNALCQVKNMIEVNDRKYLEGNWEGNVMANATKYQEGTGERKVMTKPSKYENQPLVEDLFIHKESGATNADSHQKHLGVRGHGQYHGRFPRVRNSAHGGSQRGHSSGQVRDDGQNFEYQKPANYDEFGDTFRQNSGASEEAAEAHRVLSGAGYREQGRRGGHFYGPHRGPANRVSGAYNN